MNYEPNTIALAVFLQCGREHVANRRGDYAQPSVEGVSRDSRETCRHEVTRPDLGGHYRYGPAFPLTFSSFRNGLQELGYDLTFPELTSEDYQDFLRYLSDTRQPNAATRAGFLRRVAAME